MPEVICPSCSQRIRVQLRDTEPDRRVEAQRKASKRLSEQSREAGAMVGAGLTVEQIAEHLGVTVERARKLAKPGGFFANRVTDYADIRTLWDDNCRAVDIAEKLGCHVTTVYRAVRGSPAVAIRSSSA